MNIPICKPVLGSSEIKAVTLVLRSGMLAQGPKVKELEGAFAGYCGTRFAVAFNSGTAALHAALYALGIGEGDEVITSPFTFVASANPIIMQNAKVVFADISEKDFNLDPQQVEQKITSHTKAILPIDLYGQIYNYPAMKLLADHHGLKMIEDACQAIGAEQKGKKAGTFGEAAAFSLYATKNIMCGEGGTVTTNDEEIAERCKRFRHHGQSEQTRYEYWDLGYNYRMTDVHAAIALEQLKKVDILNGKRIRNAKKLNQGLKGIRGVIIPEVKEGEKHVFHQYTIRINEEFDSTREELMAYLKEKGIGYGVYYPKPLHLHPHFMNKGYKAGDFPVAEKMAKEVLSLPVHPSLTQENINYIIHTIRAYAEQGK